MKNIETILKEQGIELTAEQSTAIGKEVVLNYKTKADYDKQSEKLNTAQSDLSKAQDAVKNISTTFEDKTAEEWKKEFDRVTGEWKIDKENREKAEKEEKTNTEFAQRFSSITADKKFINDHTKNGVLTDWRKAVESGEYKGKSDAEIYTAITKDTQGLYQGVQQTVLKGGAGAPHTQSTQVTGLRGALQEQYNK